MMRSKLASKFALAFGVVFATLFVVRPTSPAPPPGGGVTAHLEFGNPGGDGELLDNGFFVISYHGEARIFTSVDVVVTGAVIGGGADGIHKIVKVFTTFFDSTTAQMEARKPPTVPQP